MFSDKIGESGSPLSFPRLLSLIALRSFEAAARLENFNRAAAELHITHGAVSRAVRLLEDDLGVVLFERRSRRVLLTDAGRTLAGVVGKGFDVMRQAIDALRSRARQQRRWGLSCEPTGCFRAGRPFRARLGTHRYFLVLSVACTTTTTYPTVVVVFKQIDEPGIHSSFLVSKLPETQGCFLNNELLDYYSERIVRRR